VTFLLFYEMLTLSTYPLVVHRGTEESMRAGKIYLAYTMGGGSLFLFAVVMGAVMIVFEERELHRRFGAKWDAYCKRTAALIPIPKL